jgi:hypothetical protein
MGVLFNDAVSCYHYIASVMTMCIEQWWNDDRRTSSKRKISPSATLSTTNLIRIGQELSPCLGGEKPVMAIGTLRCA